MVPPSTNEGVKFTYCMPEVGAAGRSSDVACWCLNDMLSDLLATELRLACTRGASRRRLVTFSSTTPSFSTSLGLSGWLLSCLGVESRSTSV